MIISTSAVENHGLLVATIILALAVASLFCLVFVMNRSVVATNEEITKLQSMSKIKSEGNEGGEHELTERKE
jgi:hypothetical protein